MAAFNYARPRATAERLVTRFGMAMVLIRTTVGEYDPSTGELETTAAEYDATGVKLDYEQKDIDGTLVKEGDQRVLMAPSLAISPQTNDQLEIGTVTWTVVASRPLNPAGTLLLHEVQIRGAVESPQADVIDYAEYQGELYVGGEAALDEMAADLDEAMNELLPSFLEEPPEE